MNLITDTWRQMIRRKLWPLALLLVAALVAVPLKLSKTPDAAPQVPAATLADAKSAEASAKPIVQLVQPDGETKRRRVLGALKDPFAPAPLPKAKKSKKKKAKAEATPAATPDSGAGTGGSTPPPSSAPPAAPSPTPTATVPKYSIKVNFGLTDEEPKAFTLDRLEPLPDADAPVLVYEGVESGGKVAVFSIQGSVTAQGDGTCVPKPENCETLKLRAGDTEFITVTETGDEATDAQYQLDLVRIYAKATPISSSDASSSSGADAGSSTSDQHKLKGYRFDASTGTLHRVKARSKRASL